MDLINLRFLVKPHSNWRISRENKRRRFEDSSKYRLLRSSEEEQRSGEIPGGPHVDKRFFFQDQIAYLCANENEEVEDK